MTIAEDKITRDMTIESIFTKFPHKAKKLSSAVTQAGLHCVGCSAATWETLEAGMLGHGMSEADVTRLLNELNAILAEQSDAETITLTPKAAEKFLAVCQMQNKVGYGLRFDEKPAGCNGFEHVLDFSEKADAGDVVIHSNGVDIHVEKQMFDRLRGAQIDYVDGLQSGFQVSNPNVRSSCGCGTSHGY